MAKPILLHVCCAPCATASILRLRQDGWEVSLYFTNSNIAPLAEFEKRLESVKALARILDAPLFVDDYDHGLWLRHINGLENEPEKGLRCEKCFAFNLGRTAHKAAILEIKNFTTTLSISPHKPVKKIFAIGAEFDGFKPYDFKKKEGFKQSIKLSKEYELYRQEYCGCEFSVR